MWRSTAAGERVGGQQGLGYGVQGGCARGADAGATVYYARPPGVVRRDCTSPALIVRGSWALGLREMTA